MQLETDLVTDGRANPLAPTEQSPGAPTTRSLFPGVAMARIYRPWRSATTSARRASRWVLEFEPRTAPWIEPLMGWTASDDPLSQVSLAFPTLDSATEYAERQGLSYLVQYDPDAVRSYRSPAHETRQPGRRRPELRELAGIHALSGQPAPSAGRGSAGDRPRAPHSALVGHRPTAAPRGRRAA